MLKIDPKGRIVDEMHDPAPEARLAPMERVLLFQKLLIETDQAAFLRRITVRSGSWNDGEAFLPPL